MTIRAAVLTISDRSSRGERPDASGPALKKAIEELAWVLIDSAVVPDEILAIQQVLITWSDSLKIDIILTTGGTGFAPRDITPEATLAVIERLTPGLAEAMRMESLKVTPHAMLSRAVAGIRKKTLIINLPGSPNAAVENLRVVTPVLDHAVALLQDSPTSEAGHAISKT
jgi:molybdopterin adenylyltransferase